LKETAYRISTWNHNRIVKFGVNNFMEIIGIIIWLIFCIFIGAIAKNKGRSGIGFFFLSLFLTPLIGLIAVLVVKSNVDEIEAKKISSGVFKKCPYCAEIIKREAKVCRYCGKELPSSSSSKKLSDYNDWVQKQKFKDVSTK